MNINQFAKRVAQEEGQKKQVNIAQIKEILAVVNRLTRGILYQIIRIMPGR